MGLPTGSGSLVPVPVGERATGSLDLANKVVYLVQVPRKMTGRRSMGSIELWNGPCRVYGRTPKLLVSPTLTNARCHCLTI